MEVRFERCHLGVFLCLLIWGGLLIWFIVYVFTIDKFCVVCYNERQLQINMFDTIDAYTERGKIMSKTAQKNGKNGSTKNPVAECLSKLTDLCEGNTKKIDSMNKRLTAVEEFCKICGNKTASQPTKQIPQPQPTPAPQPQPAPTPAPQPQPAPQPAPTPAPQPTKQVPQPQPNATVGYNFPDGPRRMYLYWDYKSNAWRGPKADLFAAEQAGSDWKPVWVWITSGKVDHFLTKDEIDKYCP